MIRSVPGMRAASAAASLLGLLAVSADAQAPARPQLHVIENVRLLNHGDAPRVTLVLSGGRIEGVLESGAQTPTGARVIQGEGWLALPAFVDAFTFAGCEVPEVATDKDQPVSTRSDVRVDMRQANRKGIRPSFRAADVLAIEDKVGESIRAAGFGVMLSAPDGNLLSGVSAIATTRDAAARDTVLDEAAFQHAVFGAPGSGYPGTLMGYMAQLRQFFHDAERHRALVERHEAGKPGPRPPFDAELEAARPLLDGDHRVVCRAESSRDIERWIRLADEFGLQIAISGGREAWKVADVLAERGIPVILTLSWGDEVKDPDEKDKKKKGKKEKKEVKEGETEAQPAAEGEAAQEPEVEEQAEEDEPDWEYEEPLAVRRERRRLWEENRDCAIRLHEAGVRFAFGSAGDSAGDLLKRVRQVVEAGLPGDAALHALTAGAADVLGIDAHLGAVEPGKDATLALWTDDPTTKEGKLVWLFVDGFPYEFELDDDAELGAPDEGIDGSGSWTIEAEEQGETRTSTAILKMTPEGEVTGTLSRDNPMGEGKLTSDLTGHVSGKTMTLSGDFAFGEMEITFTMKGDIDGDSWSGDNVVKGPFGEISRTFEATRDPQSKGGAR
jgi:imidazolonepropionase-like amidohydrolase